MAIKKWHSLADTVWNPRNLRRAVAAVLTNQSRSRVEHHRCVHFVDHVEEELQVLGEVIRETRALRWRIL